jgi:hypothetical protein
MEDQNNDDSPQPKQKLAKQTINKRVFTNLGEALYNASFINKEALIQMADLLNLDISSEGFSRQQYIEEMIDHIQQQYGGILSFLRRNFPSKSNLGYTVALVLTLGIIAELSIYTGVTNSSKHLWDYFSAWYLFISLAVAISSTSYVFSMIRNYFVSTSQTNLLKIINLIERSTPEELKDINHCVYVPLWRKLKLSHPCKFSWKSWMSAGFRGGWTIHQDNMHKLKNSPFQEGLLEILKTNKLKKKTPQK